MDTLQLKVRFQHDKVFLQAIKSYVKKWKYTHHILYHFHGIGSLIDFRKVQTWWFPDLEETYVFRNHPFIIKDILEIFLRDNYKELFKYYKHYINQKERE